MSEHEDFYTPEQIDEQVDALLQARGMSLQDQRLASDLQSMLTQTDEDAYSLQRVLQKLVEDVMPKQRKIIPLAGLYTQQQEQGRFIAMPETPKKSNAAHHIIPIWRALGTLAAVLVVALLVGGMLFVLNATHQKAAIPANTHTGSVAHNASEQEGQVIYTSTFGVGSSPAAWSPDGSRIAVATRVKGGVKSWDARTGQHVLNYVTDGDAYANSPGGQNIFIVNVAWSPDGTKLAVASSVKIYLFDAKTAKLLHSWPMPSGNAASPFAALSTPEGMTPLSSEISLSGTGEEFENVAWSSDGKDLAVGFNGPQNGASVLDASTYSLVKTLPGFQGIILSVRWSPGGKWLSTLAYPAQNSAGMMPVVQLWDTSTWQPVQQYLNVANLAWSPDGTQLALVDAYGGSLGGNGKDVRIVNVLSGQTVVRPFGGSSTTMIDNINWSPDGRRIALEQQAAPDVNAPVKVTLWSATNGTQTYSFFGKFSIYNAAWSPDGKYLSTTENDADGTAHVVIWKA
jgi:WD40 repeat protein